MGLQTQEQQSQVGGMTTPSFSGAAIPGIPATQQDPNAKAAGMLNFLRMLATRKQMANTAVPSNVSPMEDPRSVQNIGMNTGNPHAWGTQRFLNGVAVNIRNAVRQHKEKQLQAAEGDWTYLNSAMNELYAAQQSGDKQAESSAQMKLNTILTDQKKLKNMAKALNQDWLNPEKTTVYGEALKKVTQKAGNQAQAMHGLKSMVMNLVRQKQQLQLSNDELQKMAKEIQEKAPTTMPTMDLNFIKDISEYEKAISAAREKYTFTPGSDGRVWAINKSNPNDAHVVRDATNGEPIKGKTAPNEGKPAMVNGMPIGVYHNGKTVIPSDSDWTDRDQKIYQAALDSSKEKQFLKLDPIIAAQLGQPPDPSEYKGGRSSPEYASALKKYGQQAEQIKNRMSAASGEIRAKVWNEYRPVQAMDENGNVQWTYAKNAIEGGMAPAGEGVKLLPKEAQIKDIEVASDYYKDAIKKLDKPFTPDEVAKLTMATRTGDDELAKTIFNTIATQNLTPAQQDFVVWMAQMNERAMSLRNVAGMGQGAEDLRHAIRTTLGGVQSGSKEMLLKQIKAFDNQVAVLKTGIAHPGKPDKPKGGDSNVIVVTPEDMK